MTLYIVSKLCLYYSYLIYNHSFKLSSFLSSPSNYSDTNEKVVLLIKLKIVQFTNRFAKNYLEHAKRKQGRGNAI